MNDAACDDLRQGCRPVWWERTAAADRLAQDKIGRIVADLSLPVPRISEFDVWAMLAPSGEDIAAHRTEGSVQSMR